MVPQCMSEHELPRSPALLKTDDGTISDDSDSGNPERFYGKQPAHPKQLSDKDSFADWLTTFVVQIGTIPYLNYALKYDEPVRDARFHEKFAESNAATQRRLQARFTRRHQYWTRSNATLQAILMDVVKDFPAAKQLVFDMIKNKDSAMKTLTALHQTFYPFNEGRKQNSITALFNAATTISPDTDKPSQWITKLESLWQQAKESGANIPKEELPSLLLQGLNRMPNSKIFAQLKMAELSKAGAQLPWPTVREETLQHEKLSYADASEKRAPIIAQAVQTSCLACGKSEHTLEQCPILRKAQQISGIGQLNKGGGNGRPPSCKSCGKKHKGKCLGPSYRKVNFSDQPPKSNRRMFDRSQDEEDTKKMRTYDEPREPNYGRPYHFQDPQNNYYKGRISRGGMTAMIAAQLQSIPHDSYIDSCCDSVYVGPQEQISEAISVDEKVQTAKPDTFIQIQHKGQINDLPVRQVAEPLTKNLIGVGPLCDLGWKLVFEGNDLTISRGTEEIVVPRSGNLYGVNIRELSSREQVDHVAMKIYSVTPQDTLELWHHRLMHRSKHDIIEWKKKDLINGHRMDFSTKHIGPLPICTHCAVTKSTRSSHKRTKTDFAAMDDSIRDFTVTVDTFGPLHTECCGEYSGCRYIQTFLNIGSRNPAAAMMISKSEALDRLKQYAAKEIFTHYHTDGAPELTSDNTYAFLDSQRISHSHTNPYTPEQNSHVERIQRTLDEMSAASLALANLGEEWKCHAWACAIQVFKHTPTQTDKGLMSPYEYKHGRTGDISHFRSFGCRAWVHIPQEKRHKGEINRAQEGMFVGYAEDQPGWKIYVFKTKETVISSDVVFDELTFPGRHASINEVNVEDSPKSPADFEYLVDRNYYDPDEKAWFKTTKIRVVDGYIVADRIRIGTTAKRKPGRRSIAEAPVFVRDVEEMIKEAWQARAYKLAQSSGLTSIADNQEWLRSISTTDTRRGSSSSETSEAGRGPRREREDSPDMSYPQSSRGRARIRDDEDSESPSTMAVELIENDDDILKRPPTSICEALLKYDAEYWREAIHEEVTYINTYAWEQIEEAPPKRPLRTKLVFKKKIKNGATKYKVRLVACGYDQEEGVDFTSTYSPTSRSSSFRLFCYIVLIQNMSEPKHIDVVKAYLNADIDEDIYCRPPSDPQSVFFRGSPVFKLKKALYGLKQSAFLWNQEISKYLVEDLHFHRLRYEQCMYMKTNLDPFTQKMYDTIILVYVDDLVIASQSDKYRDFYIECISNRFDTTDEGFLKEYLGVHVEFSFRNGRRKVTMDQMKYIEAKLVEFGMQLCRGAVTPLTRGVRFSQQETLGRIDFPYRQMLGSLIHAMNWTRPDLAYAINMLSRFAARPTLRATNEIVRVFQYLQRTKDFRLTYDVDCINYEANDFNFRLFAFSDSDYAGCIDTARSITSFAVFMGPALITWRSKRQSIVAGSSTEGEHVAANETLGAIREVENILDELSIDREEAPVLYVDNQASLTIAVDPSALNRSRQYRVIYHRLNMAVEQGEIEMRKVDSSENHADIGTKALDGPDHHRHCIGLGLRPPMDDDFF